jgi:hypothetical protein
VQLTNDGLDEYVAAVAGLLERYGVSLDVDALGIIVGETPLGNAVFELRGFLPDGRQPPVSAVAIREVWSRTGPDACERAEYEYELLDYERDVRRAFHLHDAEWFIERHQVVVHEHCERPTGVAPCQHFGGSPIRDAFAGVMRLIEVWTDPEVPDCGALHCLGDTVA